MPTYCPIYGDTAASVVTNAQTHFFELGTATYNGAVNALNTLGNIPVTAPLSPPVSFDFAGVLQPFQRPSRPDMDDDMSFVMPAPPSAPPELGALATIVLDPQPTIDAVAPTLSFPNKPDTPSIEAPIKPSTNFNLLIPTAPDAPLPALPSFEALNLPTVPDINFAQMTSTLPELIEPPFDEAWGFEPVAYASDLKAALLAAMNPMLQSKPALPAHIEAAIFQKGRSRIEIEVNRGVEDVYAEFGSRGFDVPNGLINGGILEVRQKGQDQIAQFNLEAVIKQYEETLGNLRHAIVHGAALEGTYINLHVEMQRFALEAARNQREGTVAILNYRLGVFSARMEGYKAEAQAVEARIRAELGKVELYRAQIEGERARGEINTQRVQLYGEQIKALGLLYDQYRTAMEAVKIEADIEKTRVDAYKSEVDAFDARWRAHASEWQGYSAGMEGEGRRVDVYKALLDAGMKRVDAWGIAQNVKIEAAKLNIGYEGLKADTWKAGLSGFVAQVQAESARVGAVAGAVDAKAKIYGADAQIEIAASAAADRTLQVGLQAAESAADVQLKNADTALRRAQFMVENLISIRSTIANVAGQLAASSMSAVSYSANLGSSTSTSQGCSTSFNFSGEVADA